MNASDDEMFVISMWQPWATWVLWGWKRIETRRHSRQQKLVGHRVGIHAAKFFDESAVATAAPFLTPQQIGATRSADLALGALICTVQVTAFRERLSPTDGPAALIECVTPRCGIFLAQPQPLARVVPMRGRQFIWREPVALAA